MTLSVLVRIIHLYGIILGKGGKRCAFSKNSQEFLPGEGFVRVFLLVWVDGVLGLALRARREPLRTPGRDNAGKADPIARRILPKMPGLADPRNSSWEK